MLVTALCLSYLLGSVPTGLLVVRLTRGLDVRKHGSGNVGATNVARVAGKLPGLFVLVVDLLKGWVPVGVVAGQAWVLGAGVSAGSLKILLGLAAVSGHIWNPFLQFKGGKGVATALGVLLGLDPRVGLASLAIWIGVFLATRYVSVASISAAFCAPFLITLFGLPAAWTLGAIAVALSIIARHRPNLLRLLHGEEHRAGRS
ncbi:MAG: glycerol-3-phosphate 1-O-acyltransferase PlsY [Candidatus Omnitrophica bacterium]|nr:glycerol-3-phosphate 1-O-acyltransferase PlsY [Candidatus Omnitrophota bacterium]